MEWNEKHFPYFHTFFIYAHFNIVIILNAVNKAAFNQTQKNIKEKSGSKGLFK